MIEVVAERVWNRSDFQKEYRQLLRRTGGLSITLSERPRIATVAGQVGRHPWATTLP